MYRTIFQLPSGCLRKTSRPGSSEIVARAEPTGVTQSAYDLSVALTEQGPAIERDVRPREEWVA
jgi:hypothetical protein